MLFGQGTAMDFQSAFTVYKRAAEAGSMRGKWAHGFYTFHGQGTKPNPVLGFKLLQKASKGGELRANNELAQFYEYGIEVDLRSPRKAFELQKKAYDAGVQWAARNIGNY